MTGLSPGLILATATGEAIPMGPAEQSIGLCYGLLAFLGILAAAALVRRERSRPRAHLVALARVRAGAWSGYAALFMLLLVAGCYMAGFSLMAVWGLAEETAVEDPDLTGRLLVVQTLFVQWLPLGAALVLPRLLPGVVGRRLPGPPVAWRGALLHGSRWYLAALPGLVVIVVIYNLLARWQGHTPTQQDLLQILADLRSPWLLAYFVLVVVVIGPVVEELLFRRIWLPVVMRRLGILPAILLTTLTFALLHGHADSMPALFWMGLIFAFAYLRTGSIRTAIVTHALFNGINLALLLLLAR